MLIGPIHKAKKPFTRFVRLDFRRQLFLTSLPKNLFELVVDRNANLGMAALITGSFRGIPQSAAADKFYIIAGGRIPRKGTLARM